MMDINSLVSRNDNLRNLIARKSERDNNMIDAAHKMRVQGDVII